MAPPVLYRVCYGTTKPSGFQKTLLSIKPAILHGYQRHKVAGCDYPALTSTSSSASSSAEHSVRGTFVAGLTDGDLWRLDIFEGSEYERRTVSVRILDVVGDETGQGNVEGEEVATETYVWIAGNDRLERGAWDFARFTKEKMGRWIGESTEYNEVDGAVNATRDPTGGRRFAGAAGDLRGDLREDAA